MYRSNDLIRSALSLPSDPPKLNNIDLTTFNLARLLCLHTEISAVWSTSNIVCRRIHTEKNRSNEVFITVVESEDEKKKRSRTHPRLFGFR